MSHQSSIGSVMNYQLSLGYIFEKWRFPVVFSDPFLLKVYFTIDIFLQCMILQPIALFYSVKSSLICLLSQLCSDVLN